MKYLRTLIFGSFLLFLMSCYSNRIPSGATKPTATAMVSKDCSGTYLRLSTGDHFVCNWKMLEDYKNVGYGYRHVCILRQLQKTKPV